MKKCTIHTILISLLLMILLMKPAFIVSADDNDASNEVNEDNKLNQDKTTTLLDIYENTLIYSGKVPPKSTLSLEIKGQENKMIDIPLNTNGKFFIDFSQYSIKVGDRMIFYIKGNEETVHEERIEKVVLEKAQGTEIILSEEEATQEEMTENEAVKKATTISDIYPYTKEVRGKTTLGTAIYLINKGRITKPISADSSTGEFSLVFEKSQRQQINDRFQFVVVSNGLVTIIEKTVLNPTKEWEARIAEIKEATMLPNIYQEMKSYLGQTIPNSKITGSFMEQILFETYSDEKGNFIFDPKALSIIPVGESVLLTITDSNGVFVIIEKTIFPKKEQIEEIQKKPNLDIPKTDTGLKEPDYSNQKPLYSGNKLPRPVEKESKEKIILLSPTAKKESSSQSPETDPIRISIESELSKNKISVDNVQEIAQADKTNEPEPTKKSSFIILSTVVLIGTLTMSGLLYKY